MSESGTAKTISHFSWCLCEFCKTRRFLSNELEPVLETEDKDERDDKDDTEDAGLNGGGENVEECKGVSCIGQSMVRHLVAAAYIKVKRRITDRRGSYH